MYFFLLGCNFAIYKILGCQIFFFQHFQFFNCLCGFWQEASVKILFVFSFLQLRCDVPERGGWLLFFNVGLPWCSLSSPFLWDSLLSLETSRSWLLLLLLPLTAFLFLLLVFPLDVCYTFCNHPQALKILFHVCFFFALQVGIFLRAVISLLLSVVLTEASWVSVAAFWPAFSFCLWTSSPCLCLRFPCAAVCCLHAGPQAMNHGNLGILLDNSETCVLSESASGACLVL